MIPWYSIFGPILLKTENEYFSASRDRDETSQSVRINI